MSKRQISIIVMTALVTLCFGLSSFAPASGINKTEAMEAMLIAAPLPAPTPKKRGFPTTGNTDTVQQPVALKGTIKFSASGQSLNTLSCADIEVRVNKASQTIATVNASGDFMKGRCSFNITGLPANTPLALLIPKPNWVPNKCSQLQFDNQAIAVPALKPGVTKPVIVNIKTLHCANP